MELLAILLTFVVHVIGAGVLVWALIDHERDDNGSWRDWWPRGGDDPEQPVEPTGPGGDGVESPALPDAKPSPVRLREPGHIGDRRAAPSRRPARPAVPARPVPEREEV
ncbi:MAG: hypothetical protein JWO90_1821 [Solirubrobacterales bacterium]|jgi:hypothetical protein|nr:hypothetical protein [Solirubrobacterales bacterium]